MTDGFSQAQRLKALVDKAESLLAQRQENSAGAPPDTHALEAANAEIARLEAALARAEQDRARETELRREAADALDAAIEELKLASEA